MEEHIIAEQVTPEADIAAETESCIGPQSGYAPSSGQVRAQTLRHTTVASQQAQRRVAAKEEVRGQLAEEWRYK